MKHSVPLRAEAIQFSYGNTPILQSANLEVKQGEMLGLVGPNGAGKTTLLRIISGVLKPQSGEVYLSGAGLHQLSVRERAKRVAMVPQNPAMPQGFTALEVVLMGRNPHLRLLQWEGAGDLEICRRAMQRTSTWAFAQRPISTLSGGERQRVFITRALVQEAPLLLLDEPTAHLDIGYQSGILEVIETIRRETPITVIVALHDLTLAAQYCDRIAILHQGAISAPGEPEVVLTAELISEVFGVSVSIVSHPVYGTPVVLPVSSNAGRVERHR